MAEARPMLGRPQLSRAELSRVFSQRTEQYAGIQLDLLQEDQPPVFMRDLPKIYVTKDELAVDGRVCIVSYRWRYRPDEPTHPVVSTVLWKRLLQAQSMGFHYCLLDFFTIDQENIRDKGELFQRDLLRFNEFYEELPVLLAFDEVDDTQRLWVDLEIWRLFRNTNKRNLTANDRQFISSLISTKLETLLSKIDPKDQESMAINQKEYDLLFKNDEISAIQRKRDTLFAEVQKASKTTSLLGKIMPKRKDALEPEEKELAELEALLERTTEAKKAYFENQKELVKEGFYGVRGLLFSMGLQAREKPDLRHHVQNGSSAFASDYLAVLLSLEGRSELADVTRRADLASSLIPWLELLRVAKLQQDTTWQFGFKGMWTYVLKPKGWEVRGYLVVKDSKPMFNLAEEYLDIDGEHILLSDWKMNGCVKVLESPEKVYEILLQDLNIYNDNNKVKNLLNLAAFD